jgi:hypothetical protein
MFLSLMLVKIDSFRDVVPSVFRGKRNKVSNNFM